MLYLLLFTTLLAISCGLLGYTFLPYNPDIIISDFNLVIIVFTVIFTISLVNYYLDDSKVSKNIFIKSLQIISLIISTSYLLYIYYYFSEKELIDWDFTIILPVAILVFCLLQDYFGKFFKKFAYPFIGKSPVALEYIVIAVFLILGFILLSDNVLAMSPEDSGINLPPVGEIKSDVKVSDANINIQNPNINVSADKLAKGLSNVGVGAAIGAGMSATANLVKSSSLPTGAKFGTVIAGGAAAGALVTATNAINSITQNRINYSSNDISSSGGSNSGSSFGSSSCKDATQSSGAYSNSSAKNSSTNLDGTNKYLAEDTSSLDFNNLDYCDINLDSNISNWGINDCSAFSVNPVENNNSVMDLLYSNYILHGIILYLLFNLIFILFSNLVIKYNWELLFIKKIFGVKVHNLVMKSIKYTQKLNIIWICIILSLLVILSFSCLAISYFILNNIDIISEIVQQSDNIHKK